MVKKNLLYRNEKQVCVFNFLVICTEYIIYWLSIYKNAFGLSDKKKIFQSLIWSDFLDFPIYVISATSDWCRNINILIQILTNCSNEKMTLSAQKLIYFSNSGGTQKHWYWVSIYSDREMN